MRRFGKKRVLILAALLILLAVLILWTLWGNTALELNSYTVMSEALPAAFDGYRIAHVSDLHNAEMGERNETLLTMLRDARPDLIAITGDLIDARKTDVAVALQFAEQAAEIAPCYYVSGNHEGNNPSAYAILKEGLAEAGVVILEDAGVTLTRDGDSVFLFGVNDPVLQPDMEATLAALPEALYTVLLSHRPERFPLYAESGADLVLSGHAHGGQFRLPFFGGVIAPNQGFFPEYDAGLYTEGKTRMIVSRGIGNSIIPIRFNNRPEVILVELKCE